MLEIRETRQSLLQEVEIRISIRVEVRNQNLRGVEIAGIHVGQDRRPGEVIVSRPREVKREGERKVEIQRQKREERVSSVKTEGKKAAMAVAQALVTRRGEKERERKRSGERL